MYIIRTFIGLLLLGIFTQSMATNPTISIMQVERHPALDMTYKGVIDELASSGYQDQKNVNIIFDCPFGNVGLMNQIAQKFVSNESKVMVAIGTTVAQNLAKYSAKYKIPLVFSTVTDPLGASLVKNLKSPEGMVTGVSNWLDVEKQLETYKDIMPKLKRLGMIYSPNEANSVKLVKEFSKQAKKYDIEVITAMASKTNEISDGVRNIIDKVDAILVHNDNNALSGFSQIVKIANKYTVPVFSSDVDIMNQGALVAYGPDQYQIGRETGKKVVQILKGKNTKDIPVFFPDSGELYLNLAVAKKLDFTFSKEALSKATKTM